MSSLLGNDQEKIFTKATLIHNNVNVVYKMNGEVCNANVYKTD